MPTATRARRRRTPAAMAATVLVAILLVLWWWVVLPSLEQAVAGDAPATPMPGLDGLVVAEAEAGEPYDRDAFGEAWADVDGNGCDTRNDVLARDLAEVVFRADSDGCIVRSGRLDDPYTGRAIAYLRGEATSDAVQIDHVVPLSYAWRHGASSWSAGELEGFANDPLNLLAVDGPANQQKSDSGPGDWLPPDAAYACAYVERFAAVLARYGLTVAPADHDTMARVAADCTAG